MNAKERGLTLIEVGAVLAAMTASLLAVSATHHALTTDAQATKCLSNLQRGMHAVQLYTIEHDGVLPGPMHSMIFRQSNNSPGGGLVERHKSMSWFVGPYITPDAPAVTDPSIPNKVVDELFRCPTATMISPDRVFTSGACYAQPAFNYACNTSGPNGSNPSADPSSTDPPHYFGYSSLCDSSPEFSNASWWPKRLDSIPNASSEWAIGDAWYRRISTGGGRPTPGQIQRPSFGTFGVGASNYLAPIPSAPFHRTNVRSAKSHLSQDSFVLPAIELDGETNLAYIDGHVAPFIGNWRTPGEGGTVNPYWSLYSGNHLAGTPWVP